MNPNFIDITVKEGGFRVHNCLLLDQIDEIAHELEASGITHAEICHGKGIGGKEIGYPGLHSDREILEAARRRTKDLKLCVYIAPYDYSESMIEPLAPFFDIGRIGVNVNEPDVVKNSITKLKKNNKQVIGQILGIHALSPKDCAKTAEKLVGWGTDLIYLSDNYGSLDGEELKKFIQAVKKSVSVPLGFQGRNHTGMALANAMTAWQEGVQWLDAAISGMGPGAGTAPLEELVTCFQSLGYCENIRVSDLCNAGNFFVKPALRSLPMIHYLDLLMAKYKMDYYPRELLVYLAFILDMELEEFLKELNLAQENEVQLRQEDIRAYLKTHRLDFDVVMEFLKTGKVEEISPGH